MINGTILNEQYARLKVLCKHNPRLGPAVIKSFEGRITGKRMTYRGRERVVTRIVTDGLFVMFRDGDDEDRVIVYAIPEIENPTSPFFWAAVDVLRRSDETQVRALHEYYGSDSMLGLFNQMVAEAEHEASPKEGAV